MKCMSGLTAVAFVLVWGLGITADDAPGAPDAVEKLIKQLKSKDVNERKQAATALGEMGSQAKEAGPALAQAAKDKDPFVRKFALRSLGLVGAQPKVAVPALIAALKDDDRGIVEAAGAALASMGRAAVPQLADQLKSRDLVVVMTVAQALGKIGHDAKEAVPALIDAFKAIPNQPRMNREAGLVRLAIAETLGNIGPDAKDAVPVLKQAIEGRNPPRELRRVVNEAVSKIERGKKT